MLNTDSENPVSEDAEFIAKYRPLATMIGFAIIYALLIGAAIALIDATRGYSFGLLAYPVATATLILAAAWAVMGVGNLVVRTLVAISIASIVLLGFFVGVLFAQAYFSLSLFNQGDLAFWIFILFFFAVAIITQVPFWLLRLVTGSHWSFAGTSVKPFIPLRDMFLIMLIFSLALSASQWAGRLILADALNDIVVGSEQYVYDPKTEEGGFQVVTDENIEQLRENELKSHNAQVPLIATLYFITPAFLTLPIFWWTLRCKRLLLSWVLTMLYPLAALAARTLFIFAVGSGDLNSEMVLIMTISVATTCNLIWLPLVLIRLSGLELRTNWHAYPPA